MGGTLANVFHGSSDTVNGTGQSSGDLKKIGYSDDDIKSMGGAKPSAGVGIMRGILRGGGGGLGTSLQSGAMPVSGGSAMLPSGPGPTPVDPGYFNPTDFNTSMSRRSPIYGGM